MKLVGATIIIVLCVAWEVKCQDLTSMLENTEQNAENLTVLQKWQSMENSLKKASGSLMKRAMPYLLKNSGGMNISSECMQEGMKLILGLKDLKPWAMRFVDSSAKILDGLLVGSLSSLGVYDECIDTEVRNENGKDKGKILFRGKYCTIDIKMPLPPKAKFYKTDEFLPELMNLTLSDTVIGDAAKYATFFYLFSIKMGVCVPSGCKTEDIDQVVQKLGNYLKVDIKTYRCEVKEKPHFTNTNIAVMFVYCFFGLLLLVGSLTDMYSYYTGVVFKRPSARFFVSFSFISNFKKLFNTDKTSGNLSCLHGLRFLSMSWIILGHTYFLLNYQALQNGEKGRQSGSNFAFQAVTNGSMGTESFFCMGGLLVCYVTIKRVKIDGNPLSIFMYIMHRLWRIYPAYVMVLLFNFLDYTMSSGPLMYYFMHPYVDYCYKNWWTNLLFINNFYGVNESCLGQTWYIASDLQLYIAALLILIPIIRWPRVGISLSILAIMASIIFTGVQSYVKDLGPTMLFVQPDIAQKIEYWRLLYYTPFTHIAPYCIGLLSGYLLATKPNLEISPFIQLIGWMVAFTCCFSTVYGVHNWNSGEDVNLFAGMMYATFHRAAWALGVAWMIVCCATGHGGFINYILSWKIFIPLGRLTFIAYLVHPMVQIDFMANLRHTFVPDHFFIVWIFIGDLCVSYAVALAGSLLIESPMMALEKLVLKSGNSKADEPSSVGRNNFLNGTLKAEKNGDMAVIVDTVSEKSSGIDNPTLTKL